MNPFSRITIKINHYIFSWKKIHIYDKTNDANDNIIIDRGWGLRLLATIRVYKEHKYVGFFNNNITARRRRRITSTHVTRKYRTSDFFWVSIDLYLRVVDSNQTASYPNTVIRRTIFDQRKVSNTFIAARAQSRQFHERYRENNIPN